jgi:hypothetical protein
MIRISIFVFSLGNEAKTGEFGSTLGETDFGLSQQRLRRQKRCRYMRNNILLTVFAGLAVLATAATGQQPNGEIQQEKRTEDHQKNADFTGSQRSALESELKNAENRAQLLKQFSDQRVIGIKYDLIEWPAVPKSQQVPRVGRPPAPKKSKSPDAEMIAPRAALPVVDEDASARVVKFPMPENARAQNEDLDELKNQVRHVMKLLEEGKQVQAFNILKQIAEN